ncbi:xanthine dehydrogenase family protein molybdopterin-binding subunit [Actinophytocola glycyrrhizae]|uniref:Xanthine dehydrogenase family protein molybdopterin-binding subunit n=1 Tax=Actinophytocola glycyrrhizae TaxID=2044873 RepID=A0ABV9RVM1_9PSEU
MSAEKHRHVGSPAPRREDARLITGRGRFVGGVRLPDSAHAVVVRSEVPHGRVRGCAVEKVRAAARVVDVITVGDARGMELPCAGLGSDRPTHYPVLDDTVRYVGQPIAVVVAETAEAAHDAAVLFDVDIEPLPAVVGLETAMEPDAALLYPEWGTNVGTDFPLGDVAAATAVAEHVVEMTFRLARVAPRPIEPRGVVADYDGETLTVRTGTQAPHFVRDHVAGALGLPVNAVRVLGCDVGGGFGAKEHVYPDEVLICLAAVRLRRPVRWSEAPGDHLAATLHARDAAHRGRLTLDADGRFVALHCDIIGDLGAHASNAGPGPLVVSAVMSPGPYRFDTVGARIRGVVTTTTPTGSYRGFGQPEVTWTRERLIDEAARRLRVDPVDLRLRNMLDPHELPVRTGMGQEYDSGDYAACLRTLRDQVRSEHVEDGRRRGIGFSCHVEMTGVGPSMAMKAEGYLAGGFENAVVRMEPDASVTVHTGLTGMGQGIETTLAQVAADELGVPLAHVRVVLGDTAVTPYSPIGSIASRSLAVGGGALIHAATALRDKLFTIAAHRLEVAPGDLEIADGTIRVHGVPGAAVGLADLATSAWRGWDLPDGVRPGLEEQATYDPPAYLYSSGAHAAAVAVDPRTGAVEIEGYWVVNDSGVLVNPAIVDGQLRGGVVQGIGMALYEQVIYSPDGQPSAVYDLPTTAEAPDIDIVHQQTPSPVTPGGTKGVGESGTISSPAAVANAIAAALPEIAERITATPLTPQVLQRTFADRNR